MAQLDMKIIIQKMLMLETRQLVNITIIIYFAQKIILQLKTAKKVLNMILCIALPGTDL